MSLFSDYGPLIEAGEIDHFTYEVRGRTNPMIYVYRQVNGKLYEKQTQRGDSSAKAIAKTLISELPKAAKVEP
jgi:hypothetical protein